MAFQHIKKHTQKSNQLWLYATTDNNKTATASADSCNLWLLLMYVCRPLLRMMPPAPLLNHCKIPPPSQLPTMAKI